MTIRYIADMHLDDEDIIAYDNRPFDSTEEMNEALIANWNRVVSPDDLTWILGDFCAGNTASWERHLSRLNGKKALIIGNHDHHNAIQAFHDHDFGWCHLYGHVHSAYEWNVTENAKRLLRRLYVRDDICRMANVGAMLSYMDYTPRTLDELLSHL